MNPDYVPDSWIMGRPFEDDEIDELEGEQMSVAILSNEDNAVFYCTTTDWAFGPLMPGANVAEAFLRTFVGTDPRRYTDSELSARWTDFLTGKMICPYGHNEADVETYGDETIFACLAKGCKAQWNLAGEEITEDEEDDELTEAERLTPAGF